MHTRTFALAALGLLLIAAATAANRDHALLFVSPHGNDAWSGRTAQPNPSGTDGPLATLRAAQLRVRRIKQDGAAASIRVVVGEGTYELEKTLRFGPEDGGSSDCPVTYEAQPGAAVVIRGGRTVGGWEPAGGHIYRTDLKSQGLAQADFHQLFYHGQRQILARHPNFDPRHPRTGGFVYIEGKGPQPSKQFVYPKGSLPIDRWNDLSQAEVVTVFGRGWNFAIAPIRKVDRDQRVITTRAPRRPYEPENRFFVQNVRQALDSPGEWFLDKAAGVLYFWPPGAGPGDVTVPTIDHLVEIRGTIPYPHGYLKVGFQGTKADFPPAEDAAPAAPVEYLTLRGFRFECARQDALRLVGARNCRVIGCRVTGAGGVGINLGGVASAHAEVGNPRLVPALGFSAGVGGGGQNLLFNDPCQACQVVGNDVWSVGSDGIFLYGTTNRAENNHVQNSGLFDKDCAAINLFGEENVARRNTLHDVPRNAVFLKGSDNVVELNDIYRTMLETCDGGAIRMCQRNLAIRGNVIRSNRIVDTLGYGYPVGGDFQAPYFSWGVYLDDFTCGTTVQGNLIVRAGRGGVHVHGGSDNLIAGNGLVDAGQYQFENNPIRDELSRGNVVRGNVFSYNGTQSYLYRCGKWLEGSVAWERNLVWPTAGQVRVLLGMNREITGWKAWQEVGLEKGSVLADPRFRAPDRDDYALQPDSPAHRLGFEPIPLDRIGCFADAARATWPLVDDPALVADEEPILHHAPLRPVRADFEWDTPGRPPRLGNVAAPPPSAIHVSAKSAAGGKHGLELVDAAGLPQRWQPRLFYSTNLTQGKARFACRLKLDGAAPPTVVFDLRQYRDTGSREYFSGPYLSIDPSGRLAAGGKPLAKLPLDQWLQIEITMPLGPDAAGHYDLAITLPDGSRQTFHPASRSAGFDQLQRIVIMLTGDSPGRLYLDDVWCGPVE